MTKKGVRVGVGAEVGVRVRLRIKVVGPPKGILGPKRLISEKGPIHYWVISTDRLTPIGSSSYKGDLCPPFLAQKSVFNQFLGLLRAFWVPKDTY